MSEERLVPQGTLCSPLRVSRRVPRFDMQLKVTDQRPQSNPGRTPRPDQAANFAEAPFGQAKRKKEDVQRVTLEDVLEAGTQNLRLSLDLAGTGGDIDFEALDEAVAATRSRIVSSPSIDDEGDFDPVAAEREGGGGVVRNEIHCLVALLEAGTTKPNFSDEAQGALERASIILHEAHQIIGFDTAKYGTVVDVVLRSADSVDVERFARAAITDLSAALPHHVFDAWMPTIMVAARRATPSLCDWLAEISALSSNHAKEALWPFIVDEFLIGLKGRTYALDPNVHDITAISMDLAIERLSRRPSIIRSVFAPGMFSLQQTFAHELLLRLMEGPARHNVGPVLLAAFKEALPTDPGVSYCVFSTRQYDEAIGWLLSEQMKNLDSYVSEEVQRSAAWILMSSIDQLHGERRGEVWIPGAIEWLGSRETSLDSDIQLDSTRALFERIATERNGIRKVWSRDCRRAASQALESGAWS